MDLVYNNINIIKAGSLAELHSLQEVDFGMNSISIVEPGAFFNLSHLESLHLEQNKLTTFSSDVFDPDDVPNSNGYPPYMELDLSGNPIKCNQNLYWLQQATEDGWLVWATPLGLYHQRCFLETNSMHRPFLFLKHGRGIQENAALNCSNKGRYSFCYVYQIKWYLNVQCSWKLDKSLFSQQAMMFQPPDTPVPQ